MIIRLIQVNSTFDEPAHNVGWHDNVKEAPVERVEFNGTDDEYDDYCDACAI